MNANERKDNQLGISHGTAANKLRKLLLFKYVTLCNDNKCFRCGKIIDNIDNFSIEHKEPWLDSKNPAKLFFDLNNIAFSHVKCNIPRLGKRGLRLRKIGVNGTIWCSGCQSFKPTTQFHKNRSRWHGFSTYCKDCRKDRIH